MRARISYRCRAEFHVKSCKRVELEDLSRVVAGAGALVCRDCGRGYTRQRGLTAHRRRCAHNPSNSIPRPDSESHLGGSGSQVCRCGHTCARAVDFDVHVKYLCVFAGLSNDEVIKQQHGPLLRLGRFIKRGGRPAEESIGLQAAGKFALEASERSDQEGGASQWSQDV